MYGLCKYGPTCKYDHPLLGYSYNYSVNLPTLSMPDPSLFPYQRNLPMIHSYETSPSKSPKFPDWMGKFEAAGNRKWNAKSPEELSEQAGSPSNSSSALAEQPNDHSDWNPKSIILLFYISCLATEGFFFWFMLLSWCQTKFYDLCLLFLFYLLLLFEGGDLLLQSKCQEWKLEDGDDILILMKKLLDNSKFLVFVWNWWSMRIIRLSMRNWLWLLLLLKP